MIARMLGTWRQPTLLAKIAIGIGVIAFALAALAAAPLFIRTSVDEAFPAAQAPAKPATDAMAASTMAEPTADAMAANTMAEPTADAMAASTMAEPTADAMAASTMAEPTADAMAASTMAEPTADAMAGSMASEPVAFSQGMFTRVDAIHAAEGTATIYTLPDGAHVLRLEPFSSQNGPDLYVGLSGHPMPRTNEELHQSGYTELARLKATDGSQNYELPTGLDVSQFKSVVIYCRAFSVVFSTAELTQPLP